MKKSFLYVLALGIFLFAFNSCLFNFNDTNQNKDNIEGVPDAVNNFLSEDQIEILTDLGMVVNKGNNPPTIEGYYFADNWENYLTGNTYKDYSYKFFDQKSNQSIMIDVTSNNTVSTGSGSFISGEGNKFSVFLEQESESEADEGTHTIYVRTATIFSGELEDDGIHNFMKGFIILEKKRDYDDEKMDVDDTRINYESDGIMERVETYPYGISTTISAKSEMCQMN